MGQGVKDVEQKGTRVEKFEKNFKKSSERKKVRQRSGRDEEVSTNMKDVEEVCRRCNNGCYFSCRKCNNE